MGRISVADGIQDVLVKGIDFGLYFASFSTESENLEGIARISRVR